MFSRAPHSKLKFILNAALVLATVVFAGVLVRRFLSTAPEEYSYKLAPHATLKIEGVDWSLAQRTVLLALRKDCRFCTESAPFYQRLAATLRKEGNARMIALFPENESGREPYLSGLGITTVESKSVSLDSLGIRNTPTLAILDKDGRVTEMWVGKLPPRTESLVMKQLNVTDPRPVDDWLITESKLMSRIANHEAMTVVDIRERAAFSLGHTSGAKNIPLDELRTRALNELSPADIVVLYGEDDETDIAYTILDVQGFSRIGVLSRNLAKALPGVAPSPRRTQASR